jgi:hypothetical protein
VRRVFIQEVLGTGHLDWGVRDGVLTMAGPKGSLSIAWPMPPAKDGYGDWLPRVVATNDDGTRLALWHWTPKEYGRVDVPPILNVPPHERLLTDGQAGRPHEQAEPGGAADAVPGGEALEPGHANPEPAHGG